MESNNQKTEYMTLNLPVPLMVATIMHQKQDENGVFKRVKENFLVPGATFSTAETFAYSAIGLQGEVSLVALKNESVDAILTSTNDEYENWYKVIINAHDLETEKNVKYVLYINAEETKGAGDVASIWVDKTMLASAEIKSIVLSNITDVFTE